MIQFNLLPDVKLDFIRAQRSKRMIILIATVTAASALTLLVILFLVVDVFQKKYMNDLSQDINTKVEEIKSTEDLDKILTVQNQLTSLPKLHDQKPVASRLFLYLDQITPNDVSISKFDIDFSGNTVKIIGSANDLKTINTFVDTLKFTDFDVEGDDVDKNEKAFTNVVLASFGLAQESNATDQKASYTINLGFNPAIFDVNKKVRLVVPAGITTRSETEKPKVLFERQPDPVIDESQLEGR